MSQIKFIQLPQAKYDSYLVDKSLSTYPESSIFFTTDTNRIYKGSVLFTGNFEVLPSLPAQASAAGKYTDRLYIIATTGDMYIKASASDTTLTQVGGNSAAMETMRQGISSNADAIASNYSVISAVSEDIYKSGGIDARLSSAESAINALGSLENGQGIANALDHKLDKTEFSSYSSATAATLSGLRTDVDAKLATAAFNTYSSTTDATLTTIQGNVSSNAAEIAGVKTSITNLTSSSAVTVEVAETATTGYLKTYVIKQGGVAADVKIDIPKDLVVSSGSVVKGTWAQGVFTEVANGAGTALKLVIANHEDQPVYINTLDLVKDHTGSTVNGITVDISNTNEISVSIADGTIASSTLAADVQASLALADSAVQDADLVYANILTQANGSTLAVDMSAVKGRIDNLQTFSSSAAATISSLTATIDGQIDAKIALLDSSATAAAGKYINSITMVDGKITTIGEVDLPTYTLSSGSANGTVSFNGVDVAVTGLGTAAFTDTTAYDAAGTAASAAGAVLGTASDGATANTVYGAKAAVVAAKNEVVGTSSDAAGTLTLNGLSSSIAILNSNGVGSVANQVALASSQAVTEANSYTDAALAWEVIA